VQQNTGQETVFTPYYYGSIYCLLSMDLHPLLLSSCISLFHYTLIILLMKIHYFDLISFENGFHKKHSITTNLVECLNDLTLALDMGVYRSTRTHFLM